MGIRLKDKIAIVTGAGSVGSGYGNGKATAVLYALEGAKVMLVDHKIEAAYETKKLIEVNKGESIVFQADVSKSNDCVEIDEKRTAANNKLISFLIFVIFSSLLLMSY